MKRRSRVPLLLLAIAAAACAAAPTTAPATGPTLPNLLIEAQGQVWLRRSGWNDYQAAAFGTALQPGDLLRVGDGGSAAVFCGDSAQWPDNPRALPADGSEHSVPCQAGRPPRPWAELAALRGEGQLDLPYVLAPRDSALLDSRPALRWHALEGAVTYTLTVLADDGLERPAVVVGAAAAGWPAAWPALQPGATYVLIVEGGGRRSDAGNAEHAGLGFHLLPAAEAEAVRAQEEQLRALSLPPAARDLLLAELYRGHGLHAEASALLEGQAAAAPTPAVWLQLGRLYLGAGLPAEARSALEQALAGAAGNLEMQAQAEAGLGLAARLEGDEAAAQEHLQAAAAYYVELGDGAGAAEAQGLLQP